MDFWYYYLMYSIVIHFSCIFEYQTDPCSSKFPIPDKIRQRKIVFVLIFRTFLGLKLSQKKVQVHKSYKTREWSNKLSYCFGKIEENMDLSRIILAVCSIWQYGLWSFQTGGTKLERFLPKNQHTQRKLLNFKNWISWGLRSFLKSEFYKSIIFILPFT